jgi:ribonucleotide monophosphatase NagD (HAD superfamily)
MALLAMEKTGFLPEETALIGDRLYTDIACAVNAGIVSIFVLSGEGTMEDVENGETKPDYIFQDIKALYNAIK